MYSYTAGTEALIQFNHRRGRASIQSEHTNPVCAHQPDSHLSVKFNCTLLVDNGSHFNTRSNLGLILSLSHGQALMS